MMVNEVLPFAATHSRRDNPVTSREAARSMESPSKTQAALIEKALLSALVSGCTVSQIAAVLDLDKVQVGRRISDLVRDGRAHRRDGATRRNAAGRNESVVFYGPAI